MVQLVACSVPNHYLNRYWIIDRWTLRKRLQWYLNQNAIFVQENWFRNFTCKMVIILSRPQYFDTKKLIPEPVDRNNHSLKNGGFICGSSFVCEIFMQCHQLILLTSSHDCSNDKGPSCDCSSAIEVIIKNMDKTNHIYPLRMMKWVRSLRWACLVTWFCYHLIAKPGNSKDRPTFMTGGRFTNDFLPAIQTQWKLCLAIFLLLAISTAVMPCKKFCSDHCIRIEVRGNRISMVFELWWKTR